MNHEEGRVRNRAARLADLYFKHDYHQMAEYLAR